MSVIQERVEVVYCDKCEQKIGILDPYGDGLDDLYEDKMEGYEYLCSDCYFKAKTCMRCGSRLFEDDKEIGEHPAFIGSYICKDCLPKEVGIYEEYLEDIKQLAEELE